MPDPHTLLANTADAAMDRYISTVHTGGTPEQRKWAFDRWLDADQKLRRHELATGADRETDPDLPAVTAA